MQVYWTMNGCEKITVSYKRSKHRIDHRIQARLYRSTDMTGLGLFLLGILAIGFTNSEPMDGKENILPVMNIPGLPTLGCGDLLSRYCPAWMDKGFCAVGRFKSMMAKYCKKSCGICGSGCSDLKPSMCAGWKAKGLCTLSRFKGFMDIYCKKSCGSCDDGGTDGIPPMFGMQSPSAPDVEQILPVVNIPGLPTPGCGDLLSRYCPAWMDKGFCAVGRFKSMMAKYCKKSCGICGLGCSDLKPSMCAGWKAKGLCTLSRFKGFMDIYCKKSCGSCDDAGTDGIPPMFGMQSPSAPDVEQILSVVNIPGLPTPGCGDLLSRYCPAWMDKGFCAVGRFKSMMAKYCKKSCGICGLGCSDLKPSMCAGWKNRGFCLVSRFKGFMDIYCKKSCGSCDDDATTAAPTIATTVPQPPEPVTTRTGPTLATTETKPPAPGTCGKPEVVQSRVIAGVDAKRGAWPWQILMLYDGRTMCGGSLISPTWVVTAAHCVSGRESRASRFIVRVGEHTTGTTSDGQHQDMRVEKIITHPQYSRRTIDSDIALMKLSSPVQFGKYVKPVCLPAHDKNVSVGTECFITGWGKIKHPGNMHHTLQQGKIPVVSNEICTNMNTKNLGIKITDNMVCAGHGGATSVSGCHGDSGGPFVCQTGANGSWELHGAVSWGSGRCDATQGYTVFARITKFRSWIDQQMARG